MKIGGEQVGPLGHRRFGPGRHYSTRGAALRIGASLGVLAAIAAGGKAWGGEAPAAWGAAAVAAGESPFAAVASRLLPAVVSIGTRGGASKGDASSSRGAPDLLRKLFPEEDRVERRQHAGSGFLVDSTGVVVTNFHVLEGSDAITVTLATGETYSAEVLGIDPSTDIAALRIRAGRPLPAVEMGNSDSIRVGDWAVAIGNPFGRLEGSVTVGVISAKGRTEIDMSDATPSLQDFIQTDASINFGNSGGPLADVGGRVIAMNTAISPTGQGIGFAIPSNLVRRTVEQLVAIGRVSRGFLGIYPQELTPDLAVGRGQGGVRGVLVGHVVLDSPASRGGVERGDVITRVSGREVPSLATFRLRIAEAPIGSPLALTVRRGSRERTIEVRLVDRSDAIRVDAELEPGDAESESGWLGLDVAEITPRTRVELGLSPERSGVVVLRVREGSPGASAGVQPGSIVKEVGERTIRGLSDFLAAIATAPGDRPVVLLLEKDGVTRYASVRDTR